MFDKVDYYKDPRAHGSESYFILNPFCRWAIATEGAKQMFEKLACYWLFDAVVSHIPTIRAKYPDIYEEGFLVAKLHKDKTGNGAVLYMTEGNDTILHRQEIPYTDIPENVMLFVEYNGDGWTVLLPSEH